MSTITITIKNLSNIKAAFKSAPSLMTKELNDAIKKTIFFVGARAVTNAPARTGRLRGSVYYDFSPLKGELGFKATYAAAVHDGTGLFGVNGHPIEPRVKKVLATKDNPGWGTANAKGYFIIGTYSRGQEANPFLKKAVDTSEDNIDNFFRQGIQNVLDTIAKESS